MEATVESDKLARTGSPKAVAGDLRPGAAEWYGLALLFIVFLLGSADRMVIGLIVEPLKATFHVSDKAIGFLSGFAYSIPFAVASLPMGVLVDRLTRTKLLAVIVAVWSLLTAACAFATSFPALLLARMAVGAGEAGCVPASLSIIADSFPPNRRGVAVGVYHASMPTAQLVVFLGGGLILAHFSWHVMFLIAGAPGLVMAALLLFTAKEPARGRFDAAATTGAAVARPNLLATLRLLMADAPIRYTVLANMIGTGVGGAIGFWAVSYFARVHHIPTHQAATITGLCLGGAQLVGALLSGPIIDRVSRGDPVKVSYFPAAATAGAGVAGVLMIIAPTLPLAIAAFAVVCLMMGVFLGPANLLLLGVTPGGVRGSVVSMSKLLSILIGSGVFAWIAGAVSDAVGGSNGIGMGLLVTNCFFLVASVLFTMAGLALKRARAKAG